MHGATCNSDIPAVFNQVLATVVKGPHYKEFER